MMTDGAMSPRQWCKSTSIYDKKPTAMTYY